MSETFGNHLLNRFRLYYLCSIRSSQGNLKEMFECQNMTYELTGVKNDRNISIDYAGMRLISYDLSLFVVFVSYVALSSIHYYCWILKFVLMNLQSVVKPTFSIRFIKH